MLIVHHGFVKIHLTESFQKLTFGKYSYVLNIKMIRGNLKSQHYMIIVLIVIKMSITFYRYCTGLMYTCDME